MTMRTRPAHFPGTVVQRTVRTLLFVCFHHPDYQSMSKPDLHTCTETSYLTHGPSFLTLYSYPLSFGKVGLVVHEYSRSIVASAHSNLSQWPPVQLQISKQYSSHGCVRLLHELILVGPIAPSLSPRTTKYLFQK